MNKIAIAICCLVLSTVATTTIFGQTSTQQMIKTKFKTYIMPRLEGHALKMNVLQGDINGDNQTDFLLEYCIQANEKDKDIGGGNALMNLACMDEGIAVYLKQGPNYVLSVDKSKAAFKAFEDISFEVKKIEVGFIVCETTGYKDEDSRCCPSLKKTVYLKLKNGKLEKSTTPLTSFGQQQSKSWTGIYSYETSAAVAYTLTIKPDNSCIYEGEGMQTFFKISCRGKLNGTKFEINWVKTLEGAFYPSDWIDKSKPIMTLFYKNGKLFTDEGQLNNEIKGGQLLFLKT